MVFIDVAYAFSVPIYLLLVLFSKGVYKKYAHALLAATNLLLILHAVFLMRQVYGIIQYVIAMKEYISLPPSGQYQLAFNDIRFIALMTLLWFFLFQKIRNNWLFTFIICCLLWWGHAPDSWNFYLVGWKVLSYSCLLCSAYALLWLTRKMPFQQGNAGY